jgi:DNA-binding SARP family transcriptional activator
MRDALRRGRDGRSTATRLAADCALVGGHYDLVGGLRGSASAGVAMEFRILGSFEVVGSAGLVDLRGAKRRGLLACLVVHAHQPMSTDRLVEELWADRASEGAGRTVQTYVSQLRKLLHGEAASLTTRPGGYVLEMNPGDVDAYAFEQGLVAAGDEADPGRRLAKLDQTLKLWRGPPLAEFVGAGWADREASRLGALRLRALRHRCDNLLELGRAGEATTELETLVHTHPLDEKLWAQFMLALYRDGRSVTLAMRAEACTRLGDTGAVTELTTALAPYTGQLIVVGRALAASVPPTATLGCWPPSAANTAGLKPSGSSR